jgi:hypothetical protein
MSKIETIPKNLKHVCSLYIYCKACSAPALLSNVMYWEGKSLRLFLMLDTDCETTYMVVVNEVDDVLAVVDLTGSGLREHIDKFSVEFLAEGREGRLRKLVERARKTDPRYLLKVLNEAENHGTLHVADQHLYGHLKTLLALNQIASSP